MPRTPLLAVMLILLLSGNGEGQDPARLDAGLRWAARVAAQLPAGGAGPAVRVRTSPLSELLTVAVDGDSPRGPLLRVLADVDAAGEAAILAAGGEVGARAGSIVTARIPAGALSRLAAEPSLRFMEAARFLEGSSATRAKPASIQSAVALWSPGAMLTDVSSGEVGVARLRQRLGGRFVGLAGQRVIVGIYDSGVDLDHDDFRDASGKTRVLYAWDQTATGGRAPGHVGNATLNYGDECTAIIIDNGGCALIDRVGHGTHVAGIAAGDGSATSGSLAPYRFTGVAPSADLIVVKGGDSGFSSDRLLEGLAYIFARAAELGRPAVVNISIGTQSGPHDGTTLLERGINQLVGTGRLVVTSAGNQGGNNNESPPFSRASLHAGGTLWQGETAIHELVVPPYTPQSGAVNDGAVIELWYRGGDVLTVTVTSPAGAQLRVLPGDTGALRTSAGSVYVDNAAAGPNSETGDKVAMIALVDDDAAAPPAAGRWNIAVQAAAVRSTGIYHMWLVGSTMRTSAALSTLERGTSNAFLVSAPGTADGVLTVGGYAARSQWRNEDGNLAGFPFQEPLGDIAFFSSPGPRRDGVLKPEIVAPAKMVIAARGKDAQQWRGLEFMFEEDGAHAANLGTSMAAPHVTGALALLLQVRPDLTPALARDLLTQSARQDAFTVHPYTGEPNGTPNAQWGYGKLDVERAVWSLGIPAGTLRMSVAALDTAPSVRGSRGARLTLLRLRLQTDHEEAVAFTRLAFELTGADSAARALLVLDEDGDGIADPNELVAATTTTALGATPRTIVFDRGPVVPAGEQQDYLLVVEVSGTGPNGATFKARYLPTETRTIGTLSGALDRFVGGGTAVVSLAVHTTLLEASERLNLSANPVRGSELIINYETRPSAIEIYSITGRRVSRLEGAALENGRAAWSLTNSEGNPVVNGVYLLVAHFGDGSIRTKVLIARP